MKRTALGAVLALVWLASPGVAGQEVTTAIDITSVGESCSNGDCTASLEVAVSSQKKKCVAGRKVRFYAVYPDDKVKFDTDRTRRRGLAIGYSAVPSSPPEYLVRVEASKVGEAKCGPAKLAEA